MILRVRPGNQLVIPYDKFTTPWVRPADQIMIPRVRQCDECMIQWMRPAGQFITFLSDTRWFKNDIMCETVLSLYDAMSETIWWIDDILS